MRSFVIAASLIVAPSIAAAQGFTKFSEAGGWNIFHDANAGGCFMEQQQDALVVQMGSQSEGFGFVAVYAQEDVGITQGEPLDVQFFIDGEGFFGTARGVQREEQGIDGAYILANNPNFLDAIRGKQTMSIEGSEGNNVDIDLTGTNAAVDEVVSCIAANS